MNRKSTKDRAQILHMLCEGNSLRSTSRMADCSINTVTKLLIEVGEACAAYQDEHFKNLGCKRIQVNEIWSFVYAKDKNVPAEMRGEFGTGSIWTFTSICADTKLMLSFMVGDRTAKDASIFLCDLRARLANRVQLTTDGHGMYLEAAETAFGADADFAHLVKHYHGASGNAPEARYSPGQCCGITKKVVEGSPDPAHISTSFVERANLTIRMSDQRFARLSNAFAKKVSNHIHTMAVHLMAYNFMKIHKSLCMSPAMAAKVTDRLWGYADVIEMVDARSDAEKSN